jgi:hypothetical protein
MKSIEKPSRKVNRHHFSFKKYPKSILNLLKCYFTQYFSISYEDTMVIAGGQMKHQNDAKD